MGSTATVVKHTGSHYLLSPLPRWEPFEAVLRGQLRLQSGTSTNPIAVGDRVEYEPCGQGPCAIIRVLERKNHLVRKSVNLSRQNHIIAANIDRAFVVTSLYFPEVKLPFLDRILVTCEMFGIPATILLNKTDLYREEMPGAIEDFLQIYQSAGYEVIPCSYGGRHRSAARSLPGKGLPFLRRLRRRQIQSHPSAGPRRRIKDRCDLHRPPARPAHHDFL